jgi:anti-anti-sigma factor
LWESPGADAPWQEDPPEQRVRLTVAARAGEDATDITVDGELDLATVHLLRRALYDAAWGPETVRVDVRRATFMDLPSLRVLLDADRNLAAYGRRLVVVVAPGRRPRVMTVLSLATGLTIVERPDGQTP